MFNLSLPSVLFNPSHFLFLFFSQTLFTLISSICIPSPIRFFFFVWLHIFRDISFVFVFLSIFLPLFFKFSVTFCLTLTSLFPFFSFALDFPLPFSPSVSFIDLFVFCSNPALPSVFSVFSLPFLPCSSSCFLSFQYFPSLFRSLLFAFLSLFLSFPNFPLSPF